MSVAIANVPKSSLRVPADAAKKSRILIAEDSKVSGAMLQDTLDEAGFETSVITSALGLEASILSQPPQLLILANWLPAGDSIELLSRIRANQTTCHLPVIVTLTSDSLTDSVAAIEAGATDCLFKPLDRIEILARVHRAIQFSAYLEPELSHPCDQPAIDTLLETGQLDTILDALEDEFRFRASTELRQPLEQLVRLTRQVANSRGATDVKSSLQVLRAFLAAARRLTASSSALTTDWSRVLAKGKRVDVQDKHAGQPHLKFRATSETPAAEITLN